MNVDELRASILAGGGRVTLAGTVDERTLARVLGISIRTVRDHRAQGKCPAFHVIGQRVFYGLTDIADYLASRRFDPNTNGRSRQNDAERCR